MRACICACARTCVHAHIHMYVQPPTHPHTYIHVFVEEIMTVAYDQKVTFICWKKECNVIAKARRCFNMRLVYICT